MKDEHLIEKKISSEKIFDGVLLHVYKDKIELPDGNEAVREYIKHLGAACVVPLTDEMEVIAVKQYRYPIGRVTIEIPAGKMDAGEEPIEAAKRELSEETGVENADLEYIGGLHPAFAYADEIIHMYVAKNFVYGETHTDNDEFLNVVKIPLNEFVRMIMDGQIQDAKTISAILKVARMYGV